MIIASAIYCLFASSGMCIMGNRMRGYWPKSLDAFLSSVAQLRKGMNTDRRKIIWGICAVDVFSILFKVVLLSILSVSQESVHCSGVSFLDRQALGGHD